VYADLEKALAQGHAPSVAPFLRMGQWIGGDRDGNPNVTAETLEYALRRQCELALRHYLTEVHYLGGELSLSATLVDVSVEMQALAERSPDTSEHRKDEPYRRALTGVYARLAATLRELTGGEAARHAVAPQNPYKPPPKSSWPTCAPSRVAAGKARRVLAAPRLQAADPRGGSVRLPPGHGRPAPELRQARGRDRRTAGHRAHRALVRSLAEEAKQTLLLKLLDDARPLRVPDADYSPLAERAGHLRRRARLACALWRGGHPPLHHQPHRDRERPARGAAAAEGSGPAARRDGRATRPAT
jgi:phosphoenolpyruvate carboxylase